MSDWDIELKKFSPRGAQKSSGVSMVRQRDFRRHGYFPTTGGVAEFTAVELAKLKVMHAMMQHGIGPATSHTIAEISSIAIVLSALSSPDAWEDMEKAEWSYPWEQDAQSKSEWLAGVFRSTNARSGDTRWRVIPERFLIIFGDGSEFWTGSVDSVLKSLEADDPRAVGSVVVLDLKTMGEQLLRSAGEPLARIIDVREREGVK